MDINAGYVQSFYGLHMVCRMGAICLLRQSGLDHQKGGLAIFCFNHKLNVKCGLEPFFSTRVSTRVSTSIIFRGILCSQNWDSLVDPIPGQATILLSMLPLMALKAASRIDRKRGPGY